LEQEVVLQKLVKSMGMVKGDPLVDELRVKLTELEKVLIANDIRVGEGDQATVNKEKMEKVYVLIDEIRGWAVA
jgi:hypothetical protein